MPQREYQPKTDFLEVAVKLQTIVNSYIEVSNEQLHQGILDVLACRGRINRPGRLSLFLTTPTDIGVFVGYQTPTRESLDRYTFIAPTYVRGQDLSSGDVAQDMHVSTLYKVQQIRRGRVLRSVRLGIKGRRREVVISTGPSLAAARLLSLLTDAHLHSDIDLTKDL
jgi:hypothetical protein